MNLYEFYWSWHEDYSPILLLHPDEKTDEEFKYDCVEILRKYGDEYLEQEKSWASAPDWIVYVSKKMGELGYVPAKKTATFGHFGSYIIDWVRYERPTDDDDIIWRELVGERLFKKAMKHNKKIDWRD